MEDLRSRIWATGSKSLVSCFVLRPHAGTMECSHDHPSSRSHSCHVDPAEQRDFTEVAVQLTRSKYTAPTKRRMPRAESPIVVIYSAVDDMAFSTLDGYRDILVGVFRPKIGEEPFEQIVYSRLAQIVATHTKGKKKKTYDNVTSAVRTAFKFGYEDRPGKFNPTLALPTFRLTAKDRPRIDPFTIQEAEAIIAASHRMHGEWYGNYEEFGFFTGLRPSEQFALEVGDCDLANGSISVTTMEKTYAA